jgi:ABC-type sugar transport system substrate-binding protein
MQTTPRLLRRRFNLSAIALALAVGASTSAVAADNGKFRIGIVTFLSGAE